MPDHQPPPPSRLPRNLFLTIAFAGLVYGFVAMQRQRDGERHRALVRLQDAGATITPATTGDEPIHGLAVVFDRCPPESAVDDLLLLNHILRLKIDCPAIRDGHLEALRSRLTHATELSLESSSLTNSAAPQIGQLRDLVTLNLRRTGISDEGLSHFVRLTNLEELDVSETEVSDRGVVHLQQLVSLRVLRLAGSKVTADGLVKLQAALPDCRIAAHPN